MGAESKIEWTDATWNPVRGCSRVSEGCRNCYAEGVAARFSGPGQPFEGFAERTRSGSKWTGRVELVESVLQAPVRWRRHRRIFVNSMSDLFHESLPDEAIDAVFSVMGYCDEAGLGHTFQILTKRPKRMRAYMVERAHKAWNAARLGPSAFPPRNIWLGVSVEDQASADARIPDLLATPATKRFLSCEPLLGRLDLRRWLRRGDAGLRSIDPLAASMLVDAEGDGSGWVRPRLDWIIAGGESGRNARPMHPEWARSLRDQCSAACVPFFFKQWGAWLPRRQAHEHGVIGSPATFPWGLCQPDMTRVGKKLAGALLDGVEHRAFPDV